MTDIDNIPLRPEPPLQEPRSESAKSGPSPWPRTLAIVGVLACGAALGVGGFAAAAGMEHMERMVRGQGATLALVQSGVARVLDGIGATAAEEAKIHDIIAAKFAEVAPNTEDHEALRKRALELFAAPTIDRNAVERLRSDVVAMFDTRTKNFVSAAIDVADQLTPEQRTKLVAQLAEMRGLGGMLGEHPGGGSDSAPGKD